MSVEKTVDTPAMTQKFSVLSIPRVLTSHAASERRNSHALSLGLLIALSVISCIAYLTLNVNPDIAAYTYKLRIPKLIAICITAFCIGYASMIFQTIVQNRIVTPCLLGMNSLYLLTHTAVIFFLGSSSLLVSNRGVSFFTDLAIMGVAAFIIYGLLFRLTKGNVLYILLMGTVIATLFTSITTTLQRIMDPNEFETLQNALIASFGRSNNGVIEFSLITIVVLALILRPDLKLLDVISLGKDHAINLGVNYDASVNHLLIGVTLLIAIATALVGPISFLGLIVANLSRELFKTYRHTYLNWGSVFFAIFVLVAGQTMVEHVFDFEANMSAIVNVGGGLYFLYLIFRTEKHA